MPEQTDNSRQVTRARLDAWLLFACAIGLALRLIQFDAPLADAHRWRQTDNAAVAWAFYVGTFNPFYPEVIWGGPERAWVQMEFPALPALMAVGYQVFGLQDWVGRAIVIAASLALIVGVFLVGRRFVGGPAARAAAVLIAVSPSAVFFGRVPMADVPMVALTTLGLAGVLAYVDDGRNRPLVAGVAALALGFLMKITGVVILAPVVWAAWERKRWAAMRDGRLIGGLLAALLLTAVWHLHAEMVYRDTGLTVGIWRPFGNLPPDVAAITGTPSSYNPWSSSAVLGSREFYETILWRFWSLHLTPIGFALAMVGGLVALASSGGRTCLAWAAGGLFYILAVGGGNRAHEYYQLPLLPPLVLLAGLAASPLFDPEWVRRRVHRSHTAHLGVGVLVLAVCLMGFYGSGVVRNFFRPDGLDMETVQTGIAIRRMTPKDAVLVTVEYQQGPNSPMLLYYSRRRGWSLDLQTLSPHVLQYLRKKGATHLATTIFPEMEAARPEVVEFLTTQRSVGLGDAPGRSRLYELH